MVLELRTYFEQYTFNFCNLIAAVEGPASSQSDWSADCVYVAFDSCGGLRQGGPIDE